MVLILFSAVGATAALAQEADREGIDAQLFRPSIFNGNFISLEDAHTLDRMCYGFGLYFNYANSVVELRADEEFNAGLLNSIYTGNLVAAVSPFSWLSLGVDVPYHVGRMKEFEDLGADPDAEEKANQASTLSNKATIGDIKGEIKLGVLREASVGLGLALAGFTHFPTGDATILLGEGTPVYGGKLILEKDIGIVNIGVNGGYMVRPVRAVFGADMGNAYIYGVGLSRTIVGGLSASLELFGTNYITSSTAKVQSNPNEVLGTIRYKFGSGFRVIGGGGGGATSGVGAPAYRMLGGIDYFPRCLGPTQGTIIVNVVDEQNQPIITKLKVAGPSSPAIAATKVKKFAVKTDEMGEYSAKVDPGDFTFVALRKGYKPGIGKGTVLVGKKTYVKIQILPLPKSTTIEVNILYKKDSTPIKDAVLIMKNLDTNKIKPAKLPDGKFESDKVDSGKYMISGMAMGYERVDTEFTIESEKKNAHTIYLRQMIVQIGKIQFDYDKAKLRPASFPILDDVIKKIRRKEAEGGFKKILIEGHTSQEREDDELHRTYNQKLSQRRTESVMKYLSSKGISGDLLEAIGYGYQKPVADNDTEAGREKNRRVEFIFEE